MEFSSQACYGVGCHFSRGLQPRDLKPGSPVFLSQILYYQNYQGNQEVIKQGANRKGGLEDLATQALVQLRFLKENHFLLAGNGVKTMKFNVKGFPSGGSRNNRLLLLNSLGSQSFY